MHTCTFDKLSNCSDEINASCTFRHLTFIDEEEPGQILVGGCAGVSPENFAACCDQNPLDPACSSPIRRGCLGLVGIALEECCL